MVRNAILYIGDERADLDESTFILFNWTMEDLTNPTVVKNSYSQQITLKGTPRNNRIFGEYFRLDRRMVYGGEVYTGVSFSPVRKTPFRIYNEMSEIVVSGYLKLDLVQTSGSVTTYTVTLYGGLGSFFYSLSYDDNGNRRTLADLDYLGTDDPEGELDFYINAGTVREAWDNLPIAGQGKEKWGVINFAPEYGGIPDGDFSADKAIVRPEDVGLQYTRTEDGKTYGRKDGYCLVNLAEEHDEWAMKDLRSYLQRPVLSMKAFFDAICRPENNGGYDVDVSSLVRRNGNPMYDNMWMTLPRLTELNLSKTDMSADLTASKPITAGNDVATYDVDSDDPVPSNALVTADISFRLSFAFPSVQHRLVMQIEGSSGIVVSSTVIFIQLVGYSGSYISGGSKVACISAASVPEGYYTPEYLASFCKYTPPYNSDDIFEPATIQCQFDRNSLDSSFFEQSNDMELKCEATGATHFVIHIECYTVLKLSGSRDLLLARSEPAAMPFLFMRDGEDYDDFQASSCRVSDGSRDNTVSIEIAEGEIRSNTRITKQILLDSSQTPADYLLSFCKIYGLHFLYDNVDRSIRIVTRNELYAPYKEDGDIIDLTPRIDLSRGVEIVPFVFESKWYDFSLESDGGELYEDYETQYGIPYALQRVDTGYEFEADNVNVMEDVVFRNAVTALERGPYFNTIMDGSQFVPSVFIDKGNTYTLWTADGDSEEFSIPTPPDDARVIYINGYGNDGYDAEFSRKLQLHDSDGSPLDGSDILVYYSGFSYYQYFRITDDIAAMMTLNDGKPCWDMTPGTADGVGIPVFGRYDYSDWIIDRSLDFGKVKEFFIPTVRYEEDRDIYSLYWRSYLRDRYDAGTRILRCRVDLSELSPGQDLLRRFFWYRNTLWVLNSITNYSFTTYDPAECEFIQVQDMDSYTQGQTII